MVHKIGLNYNLFWMIQVMMVAITNDLIIKFDLIRVSLIVQQLHIKGMRVFVIKMMD